MIIGFIKAYNNMDKPIKNIKVELEYNQNKKCGKRKVLKFDYRNVEYVLTEKFYERIITECGEKGYNFYIDSGFVYIKGLNMVNVVIRAYNTEECKII